MDSDSTEDLPEPQIKRRKKCNKAKCDSELRQISKYFIRLDDGTKCNIEDCGSRLARWTTYYLKRHLKKKHYSIYKTVFLNEVSSEKEMLVKSFETMQSAVTLVSVNGYPFSLLDKPAFRYMIQSGIDNLADYGHIMTINRPVIVTEIGLTSEHIRNHIKEELRNQYFSLMLDTTTKATLSVLGVNATFLRNDEVQSRTLGIIKLSERHTGANIANSMETMLLKFDASFKQVYAITTDNGSNMIKTTRIINENLNKEDSVVYGEESLEYENDFECDDESEDDIDKEQRYRDIVGEMAANITIQNDYISLIPAIRCCAHTLQLAIHDAMHRSNAVRVIGRIRDMCKALRNQIINIEFRKLSPTTILPPLDNATRWCSEYMMVSKMAKYFPFKIRIQLICILCFRKIRFRHVISKN